MGINDYLESWHHQDTGNYRGSFYAGCVSLWQQQIESLSEAFADMAIIGLPDTMGSTLYHNANAIRLSLYNLAETSKPVKLLDMGNMVWSDNIQDTSDHLSQVILALHKNRIKTLLIGGTSQFFWGGVRAYQKLHLPINMVSIDSEVNPDYLAPGYINDFAELENHANLFNFSGIGYQSYLVERKTLDIIDDMHFMAHRLGMVRSDIREMEPVLRDANILNFSMNAIRYADSPGSSSPSPNGFTGEDACQLSFYAGHSHRITILGIFDLNLENDPQLITSKLAAQILWYYLEGIGSSVLEEPDTTPEHFVKYIIHHDQTDQNISFYKSTLTNRWWMELTSENNLNQVLLSCSEKDYEQACRQEIPERWWKTFQRLNF